MFSISSIQRTPGRNIGLSAMRGLKAAIQNAQQAATSYGLTGHVVQNQNYNNNPLSYQVDEDGEIVPWGSLFRRM